jgi:putative ABC transport system substrate-binding protein
MRRRDVIAGIAGLAAVWPLAVRAQQAMPVIGLLHSASPVAFAPFVDSFRKGLAETGFVEHRNVGIEYRWAEGQYDRLPAMAADLVERKVSAITAFGGGVSALAAKAATSTIPIVFNVGDDPVRLGLVASLNQPAGNATGSWLLIGLLDPKKLGLLRDLLPQATEVAALFNPNRPAEIARRDASFEEAAGAVGLKTHIVYASTESELEAAFSRVVQVKANALVVSSDPFFNSRRDLMVALAARHAIPAIYEGRAFTEAGGLMSYGTSLLDGYRQVGLYTGRVLKGEKPADLPVVQSEKFELVINAKTARALGLDIPLKLHQLADEVIE